MKIATKQGKWLEQSVKVERICLNDEEQDEEINKRVLYYTLNPDCRDNSMPFFILQVKFITIIFPPHFFGIVSITLFAKYQ